MTQRLSRLAVGVALIAALAGCSSISSGTVHSKQANPGYMMSQCNLVGKVTVCSPIWIPPSWEFDLYQSADNHGWHGVSESTYEKYKVGDFYTEGNQ